MSKRDLPLVLGVDHLGYAVENIEQCYEDVMKPLFGACRLTPPVVDENQKVRIGFAHLEDGSRVELVEPLSDDSPVQGWLKRKSGGFYHQCIAVSDLDAARELYREKGFLILSDPVEAPALDDQRICFALSPQSDLVELVEVSVDTWRKDSRGASIPNVGSLKDVRQENSDLREQLPESAPNLSIGVLRDIHVELIEPFLEKELLGRGVRPSIRYSGYGDPMIEAGRMCEQGHDAILCAVDIDAWLIDGVSSEDAVARVTAIVGHLMNKSRAVIYVNAYTPTRRASQSLAGDRTASMQGLKINAGLVALIERIGLRLRLCDFGAYVAEIGQAEALDARMADIAASPFTPRFLATWARDMAAGLAAIAGHMKKVLILDCDDVLWGGIVGEVGREGIDLSESEARGKAFRRFQQSALELQKRGVMLVLCSRNEETDVFGVLDCHPHCVLKRDHLAAWRINWKDKVHNIIEIAEELNIHPSSFVFVDDDPRICESVRLRLPDVAVLQAPQDHWELVDLLERSAQFDLAAGIDGNLNRTRSIRENAVRESHKSEFIDAADYLTSLQTEAAFGPPQPSSLERIEQLFARTNQFNLNCIRHNRADIEGFLAQEAVIVRQLKVRDRFGDLGLIGVGVAKAEKDCIRLLSFLMSCRALGRGLEQLFLRLMVEEAAQGSAGTGIELEFRPCDRNAPIKAFVEEQGFSCESDAGEPAAWIANLSDIKCMAEDIPYIGVTHE